MVRARTLVRGVVALAVVAFRGVFDLRRACAGVIDVETEAARFFVQYERWVH